ARGVGGEGRAHGGGGGARRAPPVRARQPGRAGGGARRFGRSLLAGPGAARAGARGGGEPSRHRHAAARGGHAMTAAFAHALPPDPTPARTRRWDPTARIDEIGYPRRTGWSLTTSHLLPLPV